MKQFKLLFLVSLILILFILNLLVKKNKMEGFVSTFNSLDNVDLMGDKIDELVDTEKETRLFCKILRHNKDNKEQNLKVLENRNKQFQEVIDKQNKMINEIKEKIISLKLDKNNYDFYKFNTDKNNQKNENIKRQEIINMAKVKLIEGPKVNINVDNNY
jgi:hypothetical protein